MVPWAHKNQPPQQRLDWFSRLCIVHQCDRHTYTHTALRVTSVAVGRIYAMHAMRPNNKRYVALNAPCVGR